MKYRFISSPPVLWLLLIVLVLSLPRPCAAEDNQASSLAAKIAKLEREIDELTRKNHWLELERSVLVPVIRGRDGSVTVSRLGESFRAERKRLNLIRLPTTPTKDEVRRYVINILLVSRERDVYSDRDPAPKYLARVGSENVDVLLEPLLWFPFRSENSYLIDTLKAVAREDQKQMIVARLQQCPKLMQVVVSRAWTKAAAPVILEIIKQRSSRVDFFWIEAAAKVARPEDYEDLKWHLINTADPLSVWSAIRGLPEMGSLDYLIDWKWKKVKAQPGVDWSHWNPQSYAIIAAHYGHLDALEIVVQQMARADQGWWAFKRLTSYAGKQEDARRWFKKNKDSLVYDRTKRQYVAHATSAANR